jgi:hypothetical protein
MSYALALQRLAQLSVAGVARNYAPDELPAPLSPALLPCLLTTPLDLNTRSLFREGAQGFIAQAFSGGLHRVEAQALHVLVVAPRLMGTGERQHLLALAELMDAYLSALKADVLLGGALAQPAQVQIEPQLLSLGGVEYVSCAFRHRWVLEV